MFLQVIGSALLTALAACAFQTDSSIIATDIMKRVAENQDREQQARMQFIYDETVHRAMRNKDGKLLQEDYRTYSVVPGTKGSERKLQSVKSRFWKKGKYETFEGTEAPPREGLLVAVLDDDDSTKDGIDKDLFPLTTEEQKKYTFELAGERTLRDRPTYEIKFRPTDRKDYGWTGALVDKEEFQPASVYTQLSRRLPMAVRTVLGVDVPGLGFSVQYKRVDKDLWFPATFGTEFTVHVLFLFNRTFTQSTENKNFRRANIESRVAFDNPQ